MTKEELAAQLNGREYGREVMGAEAKTAKESGLVVIYGASDDLCELEGAISDEVGAYDGTTLRLLDGKVLEEMPEEDAELLAKYGALDYVKEREKAAIEINVGWCEEPGYSWFINASVPFAPFDIMEDGDKFCRGIVIDLKEAEQLAD